MSSFSKSFIKWFFISGFLYATIMALIKGLYLKKSFDLNSYLFNFILFGSIMSITRYFIDKKSKR